MKKKLLLSFCIILLCIGIFAKDRENFDYSEIDHLIETKDYNAALILLQRYISNVENQHDFDNAVKRISKIMKAKEDYSEVANTLLDTLENEPNNDEKQLSIISQLEEMEKNPNTTTRLFLKHAKSAAQFTYYKAQFDRIMNEGENLLSQGNYLEAARTFQSGFELYQEEYFQEYTEQEYVQPVKDGLQNIEYAISNFTNACNEVLSAFSQYENALQTSNYITAKEKFDYLSSVLAKYMEYRNYVASSGNSFYDIFQKLKDENSNITEASFLPFAYRFALGKNNDYTTGIVAVFDTVINEPYKKVKDLCRDKSFQIIKNTSDFIDKKNFFTGVDESKLANQRLANVIDFSKLAIDTCNLINLKTPIMEHEESFDSDYITNFTYMLTLCSDFSKQFTSTSLISVHMGSAEKIKPSARNYSQQIISKADTFGNLQRTTNANLKIGEKNFTDFKNECKAEPFNIITNSYKTYTNIIKKSYEMALDLQIQQWNNLAHTYDKQSEKIYITYNDALEKATNLLNENKSYIDANNNAFSYPAEAIPVINEVLKDYSKNKKTMEEYLQTLENAPVEEVQNNMSKANTYISSKNNIKSYLSNISAIVISGETLVKKAENQEIAAERAKKEADFRYRAAVNALKKNDFSTARNNLQWASENYAKSLELQESNKLRTESDEKLAKLGFDINKAENEIVVLEVRQLTTNAKEEYYNGNFENAANLLSQAKNRWHTTNIEENQEILTLQTLVNTALTMKTGRVILPTAPLYPEMSQLLNSANQFYDEGKILIQQGKKDEALSILEKARQNLNKVKLEYPINQEASLLTLRIDQLIDPENFNKNFAQRIDNAKKSFTNKDSSIQQNAYTDMLDLYEINPKYPGLKNDIYNAEIVLGIRLPPPDPTALRKSKNLTTEAQKILSKANPSEIELNTALAQLNEALRLDPNNQSAMQTKDRISSLTGGTVSVVLSAADEASYQKAIQKLQNGDVLDAKIIVMQLLEKERNKNSLKLQDLKNKLENL